MRILVTGSSGLVGRALCEAFGRDGHHVVRLVRGAPDGDAETVPWDPVSAAPLHDARLEGLDTVVHLAGESIAGRWTSAKKARIRDSRVLGTRKLVRSLATLERRPAALLCASAVGFYGETGDRIVDETGSPGQGFLAEVCQAWEAEAAAATGIRTVCLRLGVVLDPHHGALAKMLPAFRIGLGGPVGSGRQWMSWITLEDVVRAVLHLQATPRVSGPVNLASPHPVTNRAFTKSLGRALRRPAVLPLPSAAVKAMLGEMGTTLLLGSTGVVPKVLIESGFTFATPRIDEALEAVLHADHGRRKRKTT